MQARDFTEKIEDSEVRKQARAYIDMSLAITLIEKEGLREGLVITVSKIHLKGYQTQTEVCATPGTASRVDIHRPCEQGHRIVHVQRLTNIEGLARFHSN
jgi:hypothetical protein